MGDMTLTRRNNLLVVRHVSERQPGVSSDDHSPGKGVYIELGWDCRLIQEPHGPKCDVSMGRSWKLRMRVFIEDSAAVCRTQRLARGVLSDALANAATAGTPETVALA